MLGGQAQPGQDGFFLHPLHPVEGRQAVAFGYEQETLDDRKISAVRNLCTMS
jgi:hypothetical protein